VSLAIGLLTGRAVASASADCDCTEVSAKCPRGERVKILGALSDFVIGVCFNVRQFRPKNDFRTCNKTSRDKPHTLFPYFFGTQFITTVMGDVPSASSGVV
jgi:hypothetical protein